jgi:hypothetical protein
MEAPIRFKVTFELLHPHNSASYDVCTLHGESKAIVIATQKHDATDKGHILSVFVEPLPGEKPVGTDLVDRMEW